MLLVYQSDAEYSEVLAGISDYEECLAAVLVLRIVWQPAKIPHPRSCCIREVRADTKSWGRSNSGFRPNPSLRRGRYALFSGIKKSFGLYALIPV